VCELQYLLNQLQRLKEEMIGGALIL